MLTARWRAMFVVLCLLAAVAARAAETPQHVMLPMPDGVRLATDIYLPKAETAAWPVVMIRSTYGRGLDPKEFLTQEYAVVIQDTRGMGDSEGENFVFQADGWRPGLTDGADTVAWIKQQPWCNGKIGTHGGSALAMTQILLAPATRDVAAQYMEAVPANFYDDAMYHGGVFLKNMLEGWLAAIKQPHIIPVYKSHNTCDEFWGSYNTLAKAADITAPAMFVNGWYDIFQQGTLDAFTSRQMNGGPGAKGNNYLVMRWSSHGPDVSTDYKLNENRFDLHISKIRKAFFDRFMKDDADALDGIPHVHYYVMGADTPGAPGNEWRTAETWPPFETTATPFYLHADNAMSKDAPAGDAASAEFTFDPKDPYPTLGGANLLIPSGAFDQRKFSAPRTDLLKFASAPLDAPVEVTGRITVKLFVSTDAPDTDFTAKLVDVYPSGDDREIIMLDSIRRVKTRDGCEKFAPLLTGPDQVVPLEIDLSSISWIFAPGHRIGLHVSSSNYPRFELNPNTGEDYPVEGGEMRVVHNRVHLDAAHPSALILPLRP